MHSKLTTTEAGQPCKKAGNGVCSEFMSKEKQRMRYATMMDRIDRRLADHNMAAAHRLLKYLNKSDPDNTLISEQMVTTAEFLQDWPTQQMALATLIHESETENDIEDLVFRLVRLLTEKLNRTEEAVALLRSHFTSFIRHPGSVEWVRDHLMTGIHRQALINIAMANIAYPLDSESNIVIYNALGSWFATRADDHKNAYQWYRIVLRIHPGDADAIDGLISLHP
ncbi:MAG: hypothetical protein JXX14_11590 [Deltaproteobacteria bacterium]|nr:hypothetical protein [Deltaproteobacteria bacterium]